MEAPLDGVRIKLDRAHTHVRELEQVLRPVLEPDTHGFIRDTNSDPTEAVFKVVKAPRIDPSWSAIVGDAIVNMRSAYDHLAWRLVELDNGTPCNKTQFPILEIRRVDSLGNQLLPDIEPGIKRNDIRVALDAVQPYQTNPFTQSWLWAINKLCNADKHRLLLVMACVLDLDDTWYGLPDDVPAPTIRLSTKSLNDGDPVAWFNFGGAPAPADFYPNLSLTVTLREQPSWGILGPGSVVGFLDACGQAVASDLTFKGNFTGLFDDVMIVYGSPRSTLPPTDWAFGWKYHNPPPAAGT